MTDTNDTGEHFLAPAWAAGDGDDKSSARRIADLSAQIAFLDQEAARYRELLENDRIRNATKIGELKLAADTRFDNLRREERNRSQALHDSYRTLLNERQMEFEAALTKASAESAAALAEERGRFEEILASEKSRREEALDAIRRQTIEEVNATHHRARRAQQTELQQALATIERLQVDATAQAAQIEQSAGNLHATHAALTEAEKQLSALQHEKRTRTNEVEARLELAARQVESERQRAAATMSELLERSASLAAEADASRARFIAEQARAEQAALEARRKADQEYKALADAADERATQALVREAELEDVIAELRQRLRSQ